MTPDPRHLLLTLHPSQVGPKHLWQHQTSTELPSLRTPLGAGTAPECLGVAWCSWALVVTSWQVKMGLRATGLKSQTETEAWSHCPGWGAVCAPSWLHACNLVAYCLHLSWEALILDCVCKGGFGVCSAGVTSFVKIWVQRGFNMVSKCVTLDPVFSDNEEHSWGRLGSKKTKTSVPFHYPGPPTGFL